MKYKYKIIKKSLRGGATMLLEVITKQVFTNTTGITSGNNAGAGGSRCKW